MLNKSGSKYCLVLSLKVYDFTLFELLYIFTTGTSFKFLEPKALYFSHWKLIPISVMVL